MAKGYKKISGDDGKETRFSQTNQPKRNGRKPFLFSEIIGEWKAAGIEHASEENVRQVYEFLLSLSSEEINNIAGVDTNGKLKDNEYPIMMRIAARDITGSRGFAIISDMLDRAQGRAKQAMDITTGGNEIKSGSELSKEQEQRILEALKNAG